MDKQQIGARQIGVRYGLGIFKIRRDMKRGKLRVIIVDPPNEVPMRSSTTCGSAPKRAPNTAASAIAEVWIPTSN